LTDLTLSQEAIQSEEAMLSSGLSVRHTFLGLNNALWRVALVAGIAQLSASIWTWQFAISLETFLIPWQIGLVFAAGTAAGIIGYTTSGALADIIGRKRSLVISFIPQTIGLFLLYVVPAWPFVVGAFALQYFGWSFVLVITRAIPADEISHDTGPAATRKMTMILMPAFAVDAVSPLIAVLLFQIGMQTHSLLLIGILAALAAMVFSATQVHDAYPSQRSYESEQNSNNPLKALGNPFWKFTVAMLGYYIAWGMAIPYLGILNVNEWGVSLDLYGVVSSVFSLSTVIVMYTLSGFAGHQAKTSLFVSLVANSFIMIAMGLGSQIWLLFILNAFWAAPIVVWIATEGVLVVNGIPAHMRGTAVGLFQSTTSATGLLAAPLGAFVWTISGSLRFLWVFSGVLAVFFVLTAWWTLKSVKVQVGKNKQSVRIMTLVQTDNTNSHTKSKM
jgi:MFS family permease